MWESPLPHRPAFQYYLPTTIPVNDNEHFDQSNPPSSLFNIQASRIQDQVSNIGTERCTCSGNGARKESGPKRISPNRRFQTQFCGPRKMAYSNSVSCASVQCNDGVAACGHPGTLPISFAPHSELREDVYGSKGDYPRGRWMRNSLVLTRTSSCRPCP